MRTTTAAVIITFKKSQFGLVDEMKWVYPVMLKNMIVSNIYAFNTMVNGYCKVGNVVEACCGKLGALRFFNEMSEKGCEQDVRERVNVKVNVFGLKPAYTITMRGQPVFVNHEYLKILKADYRSDTMQTMQIVATSTGK
ncbi:hypothetical protein Patl1_26802 [Pistacia atlantica]|uniref:Uncharacterized protein n=1 Tax=Pistacia atlantica TaxID=434234 RepID=A0ACC1AZN0_9ROSI|nr:hypothetical protein Patl1_26802 [Pistacia atlantica]